MDNQHLSSMFGEIASLLELRGDDPFRIRAYRHAAHITGTLHESLRDLARRDALEQIPGIGKTLAREIREFLEIGHLRYHDHLKATVPEEILPLLHLPSLTPQQVRTLWRTLDISSMTQLIRAFQNNHLPFDTPTLMALGRDLETWRRNQHRLLLGTALPRAEILVQNLARLPLVERISLAGSLRRGVEMVADLNIVMASSEPSLLIHHCTRQPEVQKVITTGSSTTTLLMSEGLHLSLVAVLPHQFAHALLHHTGSAAHLVALQRRARRQGFLLTEHSLTSVAGGHLLPVQEEQDLYRHLGLAYIAPELREDRGEIVAAAAGSLPTLVAMDDVRGDLHIHSDWGNGAHSLNDIMHAAQRMGYQYAAICDYVSGSGTSHGLSPGTLGKQIVAIRRLNDSLPGACRLLAGAEVEISPDGTLELDDGILRELDLVIAAIHTGLKEPRHKITSRLSKAMEHPRVHILAHPANRMLGRLAVPAIDLDAIMETAVETGTCLEINSHILRLDLQDIYIQRARDLGITFALGSDAHTIQEMRTMRLGVQTARRGWVEPRQLLNTLSYQSLLARLHDQDVSSVT